jgi:hypothetical protein
VWLAQQEVANRGPRKNTGVIVAIVALTALCVIGISALLYYKFKMQSAPATTTTASAEAAAPSTAPAAPTVTAAAAPTATAAAPTAAPTATAAAPAAAAPAAAAPAAPAGASPAPAAAAAAAPPATAAATAAVKEEPGFLTVVCNPFCDDVSVQGRSLGASPVVHVSVKPGQHRVTLRRGTTNKVISVIIVSGQVTAQRVSM